MNEKAPIAGSIVENDDINREKAEGLLAHAFSLSSVGLVDYRDGKKIPSDLTSDNAHISAGSYNVNDGVILIKKEHDQFSALPAIPESVQILDKAYFKLDERLGVPHLNNKESWANPNGDSFKEWSNMVTSSSAK